MPYYSPLISFIICSAYLGVVAIFAPYLVFLIAPGFKGQDAVLATNLTRLLMPYLILVSLA
ncbi:lipid II flippase MurJ, partial [Acetomicrobium sp. S15 = DSM 107314]|uniref:lipid II flippase MurJ n=1 Tax=Acetomicrobium sp. S15 = DSM 107314 TaxID=2529858 RepID=UPI00406D4908